MHGTGGLAAELRQLRALVVDDPATGHDPVTMSLIGTLRAQLGLLGPPHEPGSPADHGRTCRIR